MNHMQLGILILNYKKYQVTADCIRSVLDTGNGLDYHIYVLDNGSGNDSVARLQALFPDEPRITWMESAKSIIYEGFDTQRRFAHDVLKGFSNEEIATFKNIFEKSAITQKIV